MGAALLASACVVQVPANLDAGDGDEESVDSGDGDG